MIHGNFNDDTERPDGPAAVTHRPKSIRALMLSTRRNSPGNHKRFQTALLTDYGTRSHSARPTNDIRLGSRSFFLPISTPHLKLSRCKTRLSPAFLLFYLL